MVQRREATTTYELGDWLRIFHPAYRRSLAAMLGLGVLGGILTYLNLEFLQGLVQTYSAFGRSGEIDCEAAQSVHFLAAFFACNGVSSGWVLAALVLMAYAALELLQAATGVIRLWVEGLLEISSRRDIEREILLNLLRKDDQFFKAQSATQIANKLAEDTERMFERREDIAAIWGTSIQALGSLAYLWAQNWSYAAAVLAFSVGGVVIIHRMLRPVKQLDGERLEADDEVKAAFEDYLHAAPEVQMGGLAPKVARRFALVQDTRERAVLGLIGLNSRLSVTYALTELAAFASILGAIIFVVVAHGFTLEDGLVAAVIRAVPQTFGDISSLAKLFMKFQLADVSQRRLLEYGTPHDDGSTGSPRITDGLNAKTVAPAPADEGGPERITLDNVTYAFVPGGAERGGPDGMSLQIEPNTLTAIVGSSGSGKSMLGQLVMGRLRPISGRIRYGDRDLTSAPLSVRAPIFGYMPQSLSLLTGSIGENVAIGHPTADERMPLEPDAIAWIERTGVGRYAREKALDMPAAELAIEVPAIDDLRRNVRKHVEQASGIKLTAIGDAAFVPQFRVLENLTSCTVDFDAFVPLAFSRAGYAAIDKLADAPESGRLIELGRYAVDASRNLITRASGPQAYNELALQPLHEAVFDLRARLVGEAQLEQPDKSIRGDLLLAGLTAFPLELADLTADEIGDRIEAAKRSELAMKCATQFRDVLGPIDPARFNPRMTWRDNLLFAVADHDQGRNLKNVDPHLLDAIDGQAIDSILLAAGLAYDVGRQGKGLSGGQRQLITLCRSLYQGSPVILMDEPTSALDPKRRAEINALLRQVARSRTIIAITHDPGLARAADQVVMMRDGAIAAVGSFDELARADESFRRLVDVTEAETDDS